MKLESRLYDMKSSTLYKSGRQEFQSYKGSTTVPGLQWTSKFYGLGWIDHLDRTKVISNFAALILSQVAGVPGCEKYALFAKDVKAFTGWWTPFLLQSKGARFLAERRRSDEQWGIQKNFFSWICPILTFTLGSMQMVALAQKLHSFSFGKYQAMWNRTLAQLQQWTGGAATAFTFLNMVQSFYTSRRLGKASEEDGKSERQERARALVKEGVEAYLDCIKYGSALVEPLLPHCFSFPLKVAGTTAPMAKIIVKDYMGVTSFEGAKSTPYLRYFTSLPDLVCICLWPPGDPV